MKDIELVIKIPECFYEYCKSQKDATEIQLAVAKGKPLPAGHGRLIDASNLLTVTDIREDGTELTYVSYEEIEDTPTIIEAESEDKE